MLAVQLWTAPTSLVHTSLVHTVADPGQPAPFYPSKVRGKGLKGTPQKREFLLHFDLAHLPLRVTTEDGASEQL